ncbi:AMP-binding protein [Hazenella sp. IB182357]|uniref:acetate--CoA ligase n=1 Tax=Polycladospora coralii TaxID=2771432 RepID=A0A926NH26_9BACL|nr:AMP-binding protein [Polycladospora coralii]MBD1373449.1 AMP-binding protein [Polycladospora coralii]
MNMDQPVWMPQSADIQRTRLYQWMQKLGFDSYDAFYKASIRDIDWLWNEAVTDLGIEWLTPYQHVRKIGRRVPWTEWFVGGELNITSSCLDPVLQHQQALIWEGEDGEVVSYTYAKLAKEVDRFARGLRSIGIERGDRIAIYLPMIVENVVAMLAIAKIGAIFTPCFSGYGADAVATRIQSCEAKVLITADGFMRRGKIVKMKEEADRAVISSPSIEKVIVVKRLNRTCPWHDKRDIDWEQLSQDLKPLSATVMNASDPFMIIYTSGTTGKPKGTVHTHAGFPIKAAFDAAYGFDFKPKDILFWFTDMGWMMGPWMVFASLLNKGTMLIFEGTPDYPTPARLWDLCEKHGVTHLGISPTLIRSLMKQDETYLQLHDLSKVRVLGSTGETWNPDPWFWLFERVGQKRIPIINYSGGTEISGGILGNTLIQPIVPCGFSGPLPGMDVDVWDESGNAVTDQVGELVIKQPWVGMTNSFWKADERYVDTYWKRWPEIWVHGDWVVKASTGYWYVTGRSDDTLKIAGKRLGPAEMESVLVDYPIVLEAATIGVPDREKGEVAVCFVVIKESKQAHLELQSTLIQFVAERLGKALKPKQVYIIPELPKTRNGKVLRRVLKNAYLGNDMGDLSSLEKISTIDYVQQISPYRT